MSRNEIDNRPFWLIAPEPIGLIEFTQCTIEHFIKFQQRHHYDAEAGGQLFWEYAPEGHKRIAKVTGPRSTDRRSRTSYKADSRVEQKEIDDFYEQGIYWLGDWHTHPEPFPRPSSTDIRTIKKIYSSTKRPAPGYLLVIVGNSPLPLSLSISWCNKQIMQLTVPKGYDVRLPTHGIDFIATEHTVRLFKLVQNTRAAFERVDKTDLPISFSNFPRGSCSDTSEVLAALLKGSGFGRFNHVNGTRNDGATHAWLELNSLIVDITADQFDEISTPVYIGPSNKWYESFEDSKSYETGSSIDEYVNHDLLVEVLSKVKSEIS